MNVTSALQQPGDFGETLVYRVAVTYGHHTVAGESVSAFACKTALAQLKAALNAICGGSRVDGHLGSYRYADGSDVDELATTVWAYGFGLDIPVDCFRGLSARIARLLEQEAVLLVVERVAGAVFFVPPEPLDSDASGESSSPHAA